jgi:hypothetical protein
MSVVAPDADPSGAPESPSLSAAGVATRLDRPRLRQVGGAVAAGVTCRNVTWARRRGDDRFGETGPAQQPRKVVAERHRMDRHGSSWSGYAAQVHSR